jgi:CheY-like chemotaxis protein
LPTTAEAVPALSSRGEGASQGGKECVLVVDDDELVLRLAARILEQAGYKVLTAADAGAAIEMFQNHANEIDIVVSDLVMPGVSGEELMKRIRQLDPAIPFMFSSGYSDGGIHKSFVLNEGIALLGKPYVPDDLKRKLREVLDDARA